MLYFTTVMAEIAIGPVLEAPDDATAIQLMKSTLSQEVSNIAGAVRECCIHKIDGENVSPIHSQNYRRNFEVKLFDEDGQHIRYDLGNPSILRLSQEPKQEQEAETQNADDFARKLIISAQIKQQLERQLNGEGID